MGAMASTALPLGLSILLFAGCTPAVEDAPSTVPTMPGIRITPDLPRTTDDLVVEITSASTDVDGDFVGYRMAWQLDGVDRPEFSATVPAENTARGQAWAAWATAYDAEGQESPPAFLEVIIANSAPTPPEVAIDPADPQVGVDDLQCVVHTGGADADGDPLDYAFVWRVDGSVFEQATETILPGDTVPAEHLVGGQVWGCAVASSDGTDASGDVFTSVVVGEGSASVSDFSLPDVNTTSATFGAAVSPRDYLQKVSGWYFGHST